RRASSVGRNVKDGQYAEERGRPIWERERPARWFALCFSRRLMIRRGARFQPIQKRQRGLAQPLRGFVVRRQDHHRAIELADAEFMRDARNNQRLASACEARQGNGASLGPSRRGRRTQSSLERRMVKN